MYMDVSPKKLISETRPILFRRENGDIILYYKVGLNPRRLVIVASHD
jgi:hypothetical protein